MGSEPPGAAGGARAITPCSPPSCWAQPSATGPTGQLGGCCTPGAAFPFPLVTGVAPESHPGVPGHRQEPGVVKRGTREKKGAQKQLRGVLSCTLSPSAEQLWPPVAPVSSEFRRQSCGSRAGAAAKIPAALQQLSSPRPSLGLSLSLCPIWRCLSLQTLWGASVQDRAWHEMTGEEENPLHVHLRLCAGTEGQGERRRPGFSQLGYFAPKSELASRFSTLSPQQTFPGQDVAPGIPPKSSRVLQSVSKPEEHRKPRWLGSLRSLFLPCRSPWPLLRASLLFLQRVLFHCCLPSSQGSKL